MQSLPPHVQTQTSSPHKPLCVLKYILKYSEVEETHKDLSHNLGVMSTTL